MRTRVDRFMAPDEMIIQCSAFGAQGRDAQKPTPPVERLTTVIRCCSEGGAPALLLSQPGRCLASRDDFRRSCWGLRGLDA